MSRFIRNFLQLSSYVAGKTRSVVTLNMSKSNYIELKQEMQAHTEANCFSSSF